MNLQRVERELKKRLSYPYKWGRKQSNDWDRQTNLFIILIVLKLY